MDTKSSSKIRSNPFAADSSPELLHQLGRAVLSYSMKRLSASGQGKSPKSNSKERQQHKSAGSRSWSKDRDKGPNRSSSPTRNRSPGPGESPASKKNRDRDDGNDRDTSAYQSRLGDRAAGSDRSDSNTDLHHLLAKVALGLFGYGIRQYLHHRKLSKQRAANTARPPRRRRGDQNSNNQHARDKRNRGVGRGSGQTREDDARKPPEEEEEDVTDPELAAALESIQTDLEGTSNAIRKLAGKAPAHMHGPGHKCDVHERLVNEAETIQRNLERIQASVNNVRNLHGFRTARMMAPAAEVPQDEDEDKSGRRAATWKKRSVEEAEGHVSHSQPEGRRRNKRPTGSDYRSQGWDGDGDGAGGRIKGLDSGGGGGGGYRHSSRLYSRRDRDREERRR